MQSERNLTYIHFHCRHSNDSNEQEEGEEQADDGGSLSRSASESSLSRAQNGRVNGNINGYKIFLLITRVPVVGMVIVRVSVCGFCSCPLQYWPWIDRVFHGVDQFYLIREWVLTFEKKHLINYSSSASPESGLGTSHTSLPGSGGVNDPAISEEMYYEAEPLQPMGTCKALYTFEGERNNWFSEQGDFSRANHNREKRNISSDERNCNSLSAKPLIRCTLITLKWHHIGFTLFHP